MFVYVQLHMCRRRGERSTSTIIPQALSTLSFEIQSLMGLELTKEHKLAAQKALGITCLGHVTTPCLLCGFWELNQVLLLTRQLLSQVSFSPSFLPQNALRKHLIIHRAPWLRTTAG